MFGSGNSTPFSMPVAPLSYGNGGGMGGWNQDWIALAVLALIFGDGWGFGGMGGMGMFLPFMFMNGGFGGFGNMGGGSASAQGALTREQACIDSNFQNLMRETAGISDAVNVGFANLNSTICNQQYDTARMFNSLEGNILGGLNAMNITNLQNANAANVVALQNANAISAQLAQCCCDERIGQMQLGNQVERGFCDANYNTATNTTAIIQNAHNDTDRIIARLDAMEMSRKDEIIADLRTRLANCNDQSTAQYIINQLSNVINPPAVPAYPAPSPCGLGNWSPAVLANGYGFGNNCCGCGC